MSEFIDPNAPLTKMVSGLESTITTAGTMMTEFLQNPYEDVANEGLEELRRDLEGVRDSHAFWEAAHETLDETGETNAVVLLEHFDTEQFAEEERHVLEQQVSPTTAAVTMLYLQADETGADPHSVLNKAEAAVGGLVEDAEELVEQEPSQSRWWKAARFAKKAFIVGAGGLVIAADVVSPDPTMLTKAASISGGGATIASQVKLPGE